MWKFFTIVLFSGASMLVSDSARACGGGGCGMSGGGYGGGRAVASRKALTGGPTLTKSAPATAGRYAKSPAPRKSAVAAKPAATHVRPVAVTKAKAAAKPIYTCPMHPQIQWTGPVDCPLCGMKLRLKKANGIKPTNPQDTAESDMPADGRSDHQAMAGMEGMESMEGTHGMSGMDDMMMCPGCMGGMSGMGGGAASPKASGKAMPVRGGSMQSMAGMGCGC